MNIDSAKVLYVVDINGEAADIFLDTISRLSILNSNILVAHIHMSDNLSELSFSPLATVKHLLTTNFHEAKAQSETRLERLKRGMFFYMGNEHSGVLSNEFDFMALEGNPCHVISTLYDNNAFDVLILANSFLSGRELSRHELHRIIKQASYPVVIS